MEKRGAKSDIRGAETDSMRVSHHARLTGIAPPTPAEFAFHIPPRSLPEYVHDRDHVAFWQVRGKTTIRCGADDHDIAEGVVIWLPVGTAHAVNVQANSVMFPLVFPVDEVATLLHEITTVRIREEEKIYFLALFQDQSTIISKARNLIRQVLAILERNALAPDELPIPASPAAAVVARALLFNPGDERRISDWAREVHASGRTLERTFLQETGITFGEWRNRARMHAASRLLRAGASVTSVTHRVGFNSPNSFARAFRSFHGQSPTEHAAG